MSNKKGFLCQHCSRQVFTDHFIGTSHRNHCPFCLWSKHLDFQKSGDRKAQCLGEMKPLGLTFKHEGWDKYTGKPKQGETMLIHQCTGCNEISINRLAADDEPEMVLKIFEESKNLEPKIKEELEKEKIKLLTEEDEGEIKNQLFGKK